MFEAVNKWCDEFILIRVLARYHTSWSNYLNQCWTFETNMTSPRTNAFIVSLFCNQADLLYGIIYISVQSISTHNCCIFDGFEPTTGDIRWLICNLTEQLPIVKRLCGQLHPWYTEAFPKWPKYHRLYFSSIFFVKYVVFRPPFLVVCESICQQWFKWWLGPKQVKSHCREICCQI